MRRDQEEKALRQIKELMAKNDELDKRQQAEIEGLKKDKFAMAEKIADLSVRVDQLETKTSEPTKKGK